MRRERYSKDNLTPLSSSFVCYFLNTFLEQKCAMIDFYTILVLPLPVTPANYTLARGVSTTEEDAENVGNAESRGS
jgi:hypothetical protein